MEKNELQLRRGWNCEHVPECLATSLNRISTFMKYGVDAKKEQQC